MTDSELEFRLFTLVREERKISEEILDLIRTADQRRLYLQRGFPNLFEWLVRGYGFSHAAAYRRIQAAQLLGVVPEARAKLREGAVSLTTLAQVQSVVRKEERRVGARMAPEQKRALVKQVEGKSSVAAEQVLAAAFPEVAGSRDSLRAVNGEESRLSVVLPAEAVENLRRAQELLSHSHPHASYAEVLAHLLAEFVRKKDPVRAPPKTQSATDKRSVNIPALVRREIFQKSQGRCVYRDSATGRVCGSRWQVEVDHRLPRALGGGHQRENLRCLCRQHNLWEAERLLGTERVRGKT